MGGERIMKDIFEVESEYHKRKVRAENMTEAIRKFRRRFPFERIDLAERVCKSESI